MPKQKPHKGLRKRTKITGTGKVMRKKAFRGHLMSGKTGNRCQRLRRNVVVEGALARNLKRALVAG
ncbi:MAG: 50S ribosomal protein L35 [Planctomycetota bacterium]